MAYAAGIDVKLSLRCLGCEINCAHGLGVGAPQDYQYADGGILTEAVKDSVGRRFRWVRRAVSEELASNAFFLGSADVCLVAAEIVEANTAIYFR